MYSRPSHQFTRQVWWDSLLSLYHDPFSNHLVPISAGRRNEVASEIVNDLKFIFRASNYWFSFFHVPRFFATYHNAQTRSEIQPALILILITMSIFFRSSEREGGAAGRERALRFRDHAQAALEASFNSGWIDETLAQAAFVCDSWMSPQSMRLMFYSSWLCSKVVATHKTLHCASPPP